MGMARKQPTGTHGGKREGAGRPVDSKNTLGYGEVKAVKAAGLRVPKDAPADQRDLADAAQQRIVDVMNGTVHYTEAATILKAATHIRSEICGPVAQKLEHSGKDGEALSFVINMGGGK